MNIERSEAIRFHERGTLDAVTRWISSHPEGIAEWFKNVRRQYQVDRADVSDEERAAVLLLRDAKGSNPARIGLLDVGGATLEDVTAWSTWQDPDASSRGSSTKEEQTQGNGGKAYMFRFFTGATRILGIRDRRRNCKGFQGEDGTVERGTPGWVPSVSAGRDVDISSLDAELEQALKPYSVEPEELPPPVLEAIRSRGAFTLVEGEGPKEIYKGRIQAEDLIAKVIRNDQSTLCLEQVAFYAMHNGRPMYDGKRLVLPPIMPYPGLETPIVHEIPEELPLDKGQVISTTEGGSRTKGRLILHTSSDNMPNAYKNLKPRWQIVYRTSHQMIGAKAVSELCHATAGAQFVYGVAELAALEPTYVDHGRRRPKDGPLMEALDRFISEKIRQVARQISAQRKQDLDSKALDEVHKENQRLDAFKNRYLPEGGAGDGGMGDTGSGPSNTSGGDGVDWGEDPDAIECSLPDGGILCGRGVKVALRAFLELSVRDEDGRPVRADLTWKSTDPKTARVTAKGELVALEKGECQIWAELKNGAIQTPRIPVEVWAVDHVLLTPRNLDLPLGKRHELVAEVTDDDGRRSTEVLLDWKHDADDPLVVRISRTGVVTGNRLGRTAITAGAGSVWARIPAEIHVIPNPEKEKKGGGFPKLLLTGRDLDPATGQIREGDPDQPALWQEPSDFIQNVWWLNLESSEAAYAFRQRAENPILWRTYHADSLINMVVQVWMDEEYTRKGDSQRPDFWAAHRATMDRHRVRMVQSMWSRLEPYVSSGSEIKLTGEESA